MGEYAFLDENGIVINVIVADQDFIDSLQSQIDDENVDTGNIALYSTPVRIDELSVKPGNGWRKSGNKWVSPDVSEPPQPEPNLEDEVLSSPTLSGLSAAEKAAVANAIRQAQGRGPN
jgi:hypothetical protein